MSETEPELLMLPEPFGAIRPARRERQRWERQGVERPLAWGVLDVGYDEAGAVVRVEYHWFRRLSTPEGEREVLTAELWAKRPAGDWLYVMQPEGQGPAAVPHEPLRRLLAAHINVDIGPPDPEGGGSGTA